MSETIYTMQRNIEREIPHVVHYGCNGDNCLFRLILGPRPDGTYEENYLTIISHERLDIEKRVGRRLENVRR